MKTPGRIVWGRIVCGDVDSDGDLDLVVRGQTRLYLNLQRQLDAPFVLRVGRTYQLDAYSRYGPASQIDIGLPFLSAATASIPLPPLGVLGLDPNQMIGLPPFVIPRPAGIGSLTFPIPNLPSLAGIPIYTQALLVQQPVQIRLTNVVADTLLR